jgi:hypothetical protein
VSFVVSLSPRVASAQMYESVGIRAQGMGGAFVGVADDASATWWNPAGVAAGPYFDLVATFAHPDFAGDQRQYEFAGAIPSLGLSYYRLPLRQVRPANATAGDVSNRQDQGYLSQFGATFGQSLGSLVFASTVKVLNANGDTHADLDVGVMVRVRNIRGGVSLRNLHETAYGSGPDAFELKRIARAGVSVSGNPGGVIWVTGAFDADLTTVQTAAGDARHIAGGGELWVWKRIIGLRGGLSEETIHNVNSQSGGVSVMALAGQYLKTYVDAQWTGGSDLLRRGWGVDLRLTF